MNTPSKEKWMKIAEEFEEEAYFPNRIGALDGKHVRLILPGNSGSILQL